MKKHFIGATYDLTQENMNGLIQQIEEQDQLLDEVESVLDAVMWIDNDRGASTGIARTLLAKLKAHRAQPTEKEE